MSLDKDLYRFTDTCPYNCWKIGCTWQCINKEIPYKDTQIPDKVGCEYCGNIWCHWGCLTKKEISNIIEYFQPKSENMDIEDENKTVKTKLLQKLSQILLWINLSVLTWEQVEKLWKQISSIWAEIMEKEWDYSLGLQNVDWMENNDLNDIKITKSIEKFKKPKDFYWRQLKAVNTNLENYWSVVMWLINKLQTSLNNKNNIGSSILSIWIQLYYAWVKIKHFEAEKQTLEIQKWV